MVFSFKQNEWLKEENDLIALPVFPFDSNLVVIILMVTEKNLGGGGSFWVAKLFPQSLNMYGHPMNK